MNRISENIAVLILAAGLGKRMGQNLPKVALPLAGRALIERVMDAALALEPEMVVPIVGHGREHVEKLCRAATRKSPLPEEKLRFAFQPEQLGTGHAVRCALPELAGFLGTVLILCGDVPFISSESLKLLLALHEEEKATLSLITGKASVHSSYGRIRRSTETSEIEGIVERKDCSAKEQTITEINAGIYAVDSSFLTPAVEALENNNAQGEFYFVDILEKAASEGQRICSLFLEDSYEYLGINTPGDLAQAERVFQKKLVQKAEKEGVSFLAPETVCLDETVSFSPGVVVGPNVHIQGNSTFGKDVVIEGTAQLRDVSVGANTTLKLGIRAEECSIGENCAVGPFAHIRPGSVLEADVKVGNFVETKKAFLHQGAKASHLTYLGDCEVGEEANIGAGTITCNYDGYKKSKTTIEPGAFIGSNTALVAPVVIGENAIVGAGSTISNNVPAESLVFTRAPETTKKGWAKRKRDVEQKKAQAKKEP